MVMRKSLKSLAWRYLEVGAFGDREQHLCPHSLNLHNLNLRTTDNPNRGPVTWDLVATTGHKLWQETEVDGRVRPYDFIVGLPDAGLPFAEALARAHKTVGRHVELLQMKKAAPNCVEYSFGLTTAPDKSRGTVLVVDDSITDAENTLESIALLKRHGFEVWDVLVIVDLQQGGAENLAKAGLNLHALFAIDQLRELGCFVHPVA